MQKHRNSFSESPKPFEATDLYLHFKITELEGSPTDERVACTVQSVDRENDSYRTKIWTYPTAAPAGGAGTQITQGNCNDHSPHWSPDGRQLAFVSDRNGGAQIYLLGMASAGDASASGGEARQLSQLPGGATSLRWMPDGRALLATSAVAVDPNLRGARSTQAAPARAKTAAEVVWKLPYKSDGMGYLLAREIHLFKIDATTGDGTQLTNGAFDVLAHSVSHDGQQLAYVRTREGRFAHETDLWTCTADGENHVCVVNTHAHTMQPMWSPSGRYIAFTGAVQAGDAVAWLWLYDTATGKTRQLGDVEVADPMSVHWKDDNTLVFLRAHRGRHEVARMTLDGKHKTLLGGDHQIGAFGWTAKHFAMAIDHPAQPCELHVCGGQDCNNSLHQVSDLNPWWKERTAIQVDAVSFQVPGDSDETEEIEGWLIRAKDNTGPSPLFNDIHGGPAAYALLDFDSTVHWQVLCSQGWAILALNAVGSASFGQDFNHRLAGLWGMLDMPQHLAAIASLQADGVCDERLAVCGKSYGGYLTAWTIGHTDLFKAAVVMAPVGNIETHYGTSDGGYYADPFYMATAPRFDREKARSLSPLQHIEKANTPTLFMQGKEDERCPKCQSEELFVSFMRASDSPTELVLYPDEGHGFLGEGAPACRADASQRIVNWVSQHVLSGEGTAASAVRRTKVSSV
ncbi:S9 family peptidase [Comamonas endophytica]|uniref:S9 family peptidase n=1 Tax=Comamonas endophytica TaxID=2949090 RepID=A0ABY6GGG2_9BURK|nr:MULTISPECIES: S9 family peptidase [unclassified Acidovorax]MCD2513186.1 S9 family peptidase [Acidovorax sp. D4N7]UYG53467.1 S9 family peptidase [Acidovorax sp. 5MLIR]